MSKTKRFVTLAEYQRMTGLSYPTVKNALETGELRGIRTEAGYWKIDVEVDGNTDVSILARRLDGVEGMLEALCCHLGVKR